MPGRRRARRAVNGSLKHQHKPLSKLARTELRPHGIKVHGVTPETLLAIYLDAPGQESSPGEPERLCACGCGQPIPTGKRRGQLRKYIDETHGKRAQRVTRSDGRLRAMLNGGVLVARER